MNSVTEPQKARKDMIECVSPHLSDSELAFKAELSSSQRPNPHYKWTAPIVVSGEACCYVLSQISSFAKWTLLSSKASVLHFHCQSKYIFEDKTRLEFTQTYFFNTKGNTRGKHESIFNFYVTTFCGSWNSLITWIIPKKSNANKQVIKKTFFFCLVHATLTGNWSCDRSDHTGCLISA